jgi:hypothetical protein
VLPFRSKSSQNLFKGSANLSSNKLLHHNRNKKVNRINLSQHSKNSGLQLHPNPNRSQLVKAGLGPHSPLHNKRANQSLRYRNLLFLRVSKAQKTKSNLFSRRWSTQVTPNLKPNNRKGLVQQ